MKDDSVSRQAVVDAVKSYWKKVIDDIPKDTGFDEATKLCDMALEHNIGILKAVDGLPSAQPDSKELSFTQKKLDTISRQDAIDAIDALHDKPNAWLEYAVDAVKKLPSAQPDIVHCNDCEYGEQDEVGRWFCRSFGCQVGNEDGSGYCADAERRTGWMI